MQADARAILTFACLFHAVFSTILRLPCLTQADFKIFEIGKRLKDNVMSKHRDTTDVQCTVLCVENTKCRSYNIHIAKLICELNSKAWIDNGTTLTDDAEWVYRSTDYNELLVGPVCKDLKPCDNGTLCRDTCSPPYYECVYCDEQHTGLHCDIPREINECHDNPCQNSGECVDKRVGYECMCNAGFTGRNCENYINGCDSLPCFNGGTCQNTTGSYNCTCALGYSGFNCEDFDSCISNPCQFYEYCVSQVNNYTCAAATNVALYKRTSQSSTDNINHSSEKAVDGNSDSDLSHNSCSRTNAEKLAWWEVDFDRIYLITGVEITNRGDCCARKLKEFNVTVDGNLCLYRSSQLGDTIKLPCTSAIKGQRLKIQLHSNKDLVLCEVKVFTRDEDTNECLSSPCQHGGTCTDYYQRYSCQCVPGFLGNNCETKYDGCSSNPCQFYERCINIVDRYSCSTLTNIALFKATTQSSTFSSHKALYAVDGKSTTDFSQHSCSHTELDSFPWWEVDFGSTYTVTGVELTNRGDCCGDRLKNFDVTVDSTLCVHRSEQIPQGKSVKLACSSTLRGRRLKVKVKYSVSLTLCEVKVYSTDQDVNECLSSPCQNGGTCTDFNNYYTCQCVGNFIGSNCQTEYDVCSSNPCQFYERCVKGASQQYSCVTLTNIALHKTATQSSTYSPYIASYGVDGNKDTDCRQESCAHTRFEVKPWWEVDFGSTYSIVGVEITNRGDCCGYRLRNFDVTVDGSLCFHRSDRIPQGTSLAIPCSSVLNGRRLKVQLQYTEYLTLCEVDVYSLD